MRPWTSLSLSQSFFSPVDDDIRPSLFSSLASPTPTTLPWSPHSVSLSFSLAGDSIQSKSPAALPCRGFKIQETLQKTTTGLTNTNNIFLLHHRLFFIVILFSSFFFLIAKTLLHAMHFVEHATLLRIQY